MYPLWWYPTSVYWSTGAMLQSIGQCFSQLGTASVNGALLQSMGQCFSQQELQWNLNVMPYCLESSFRRTSQCDVISIIGLIIQFFASAQIQQIRQRRRLFSRKWKQILQFYSRLKNCKLNLRLALQMYAQLSTMILYYDETTLGMDFISKPINSYLA